MPAIKERIELQDLMSDRLKQIADSLSTMITLMQTANISTRQLQSNLNSAITNSITNSMGGLSTQMERVANNTQMMSESFGRSISNVNSGINRTTQNTSKLGSILNSTFAQFTLAEVAGNMIIRLGEAIESIPSKLISLSDEFIGTQSRIGLITDDVQGLSNAIYQASIRSRGSYSTMTDTVAKLGLTARNAFKSTEEIVPFVENIQKLFTIGGTDVEHQKFAMLQLQQALGSGRLQGDEFRSIAENAPMIEQIIAKYMGVAQGELRQLSRDGEITAEVMRNAILGATDDINEQFRKMPRTFNQTMQMIKSIAFNAFSPVFRELNSLANSEAFNNMISGFERFARVSSIAIVGVINNVKWLANSFSEAYNKYKGFIEPFINGIGIAIGLLAIFKISMLTLSAITSFAGGVRTLFTMIQLLPTAIGLMRSLGIAQALASMTAFEMFASLILPIGLILGGIYLLIDSFGMWQSVTEYALSFIVGALLTAFYTVTVLSGAWLLWNGLKLIGYLYEVAYAGMILITNSYLAIMYIRTLAVAGAQALLNSIMSMNPLPLIIALVFIVISAFVGWQVASNGLRNTLQDVFSSIAGTVAEAINFMIDKINGLISAFNVVKQLSNEIFKTNFSATGEISWRADVQSLRQGGKDFGNKVADFIENPTGVIQNALGNLPLGSDYIGGGGGMYDVPSYIGGAGKEPKPVTVKGGKLDKDQEITLAEENLQLITDLARKEVVLNYQQITPQVTITMGDIRETVDVDTVLDRMETRIIDLYNGSLKGV